MIKVVVVELSHNLIHVGGCTVFLHGGQHNDEEMRLPLELRRTSGHFRLQDSKVRVPQ